MNIYYSTPIPACFDGDEPLADDGDKPYFSAEHQKVVNHIVAETRRKFTDRIDELTKQVESVSATKDDERAKAISEWEGKYNSLKSKHETALVQRSLTDAAAAGDAFAPEQILTILQSHAAVHDDAVVVEIEGFRLSPQEAVAWMQNQPERYGNLFRSPVTGGVGGNNGQHLSKPGGLNLKTMTPEQYRQVRKSNPRLLGLEP